jgi:hypothetical protein
MIQFECTLPRRPSPESGGRVGGSAGEGTASIPLGRNIDNINFQVIGFPR